MIDTVKLQQYGGRMIETDARPTVELVDPNDNARKRFQYRRTLGGVGTERRVLCHDGAEFIGGSAWEAVDLPALQAVRGKWHPILDPLGFGGAA